jgi:uncharacterized membrane protein (UPF0182 family)
MANYPYSERQSLSDLTHTSLRQGQRDQQINYIRNSVKATVDAYDGTVTLYQWDTEDPVLKAWMSIFPGLVKPKSAMPPDIRAHVRYPQDFFDVQRGLLAQYHITQPVDAYNGKGKWAVPQDPFDPAANQPPYYVLARAPGSVSNAPEFQLTTPMVVNGASNLAAYVSADCDYNNYGQLTVLQVTGQSTIYGPGQVANDLKSTAVISKDITQLGQGQSAVVHGNLLTLPVGNDSGNNAFLYVEPLYVESTGQSAFPTLQRVLVRYGNGNNVGYGGTLEDALDDLRDHRQAGSSINQLGQVSGNGQPGSPNSGTPTNTSAPGSTSSGAPTPTPTPTDLDSLLAQLASAQADLNAAYKSGNEAQIGAAQGRVLDLAKRLAALQTPTASPTPTPTPKKTK